MNEQKTYLCLIAFFASLTFQGCNPTRLPKGVELSPIDDGGYRLFMDKANEETFAQLELDPDSIKEIYLNKPANKVLLVLAKYKQLQGIYLTSMEEKSIDISMTRMHKNLTSIGIYNTPVELAASASMERRPAVKYIYIDSFVMKDFDYIKFASEYPNADITLFSYVNEKDLYAKNVILETGNHYITIPRKDATLIRSFIGNKESFGSVICTLRNSDPKAIKALNDIAELQRVRIDSAAIKREHMPDILQNKCINTLDIVRSGMSKAEIDLIRDEYPNIIISN